MKHPYLAFEGTPEWEAIDDALRDLEENRDVEITTARPYVVGYLVRALTQASARGGASGDAAPGQAAPETSRLTGRNAARFTGDDYQLIADAAYREEDRRELFEQLHGIPAPSDDQLKRLADFGRRLSEHLREHDARGGASQTTT